jgi:integrase
MNLSAKTVAKLTLPDGKTDLTHWDSELTGFGYRLRRRASCIRASWIVQYRAHGRVRRLSLGDSGVLSAVQARAAARSVLAQVALGNDPLAEKETKRQDAKHTVGAVIRDYLDAKASELRPASLRVTRLYLTGTYFRDLHSLPITAVTRSTVAPLIRAIERKHSTSTASACRRALSALFAWATAEGLLGDGANPVNGAHRPSDPQPRDRVLDAGELAAIWRVAGDNDFGYILRLLILLGSRRQEIGGMRWSELDLGAGTWTLPAERSKNARSLKLSLPPAAHTIIASVERTERDHLFGDRADGFTSWEHGKRALDQRLAGSVRPWRLHDLRRSVATGMADIGVLPHVIEACLNHYGGHRKGPAGVYNRSQYESAMESALLRWSQHVSALVEGRQTKGKVVKLRGWDKVRAVRR